MVITVASSLPENAVAKVAADYVNAETLCALIEKEKAEASHKGVTAAIVLKVDPQAPFRALENVLDCCGAKEVTSVTITDSRTSCVVRIRFDKGKMKEPYIFVAIAMPDGLGDIVAGIREVTPGAVGTEQAASIVQDLDVVREVLARAKERLIRQKAKTLTVVIDSRPDVPVSRALSVLSICEEVGLTPEFIAPKW
jgi:hypothetical protein